MEKRESKRAHFVLVHGACHGGWCWYKVATLLRAAGHTVTAPDLAACGVDARRLDEVGTFSEYARPLLEVMSALPPGERVVLVGHSYGGLVVALAADKFPEKVAVAVFLTAIMPDTSTRPSYVLEEVLIRLTCTHLRRRGVCICVLYLFSNIYVLPLLPRRTYVHKYRKKFHSLWVDTEEFSLTVGESKRPLASFLLGPKFTHSLLYQLCPPEDVTLGLSLMRVGSFFLEDLCCEPPFSEMGYGSVKKVYIVCSEDLTIPKDFQLWMTENYAVDEVKVVEAADHMPMLSTPQELYRTLEDIADVHV